MRSPWTVCALAACLISASAGAAPDADYGEMYVVQKRETPRTPWQGSLAYTYGFSNPYLSIHGAQLQLSRQLGDYFSLGVSPTLFAPVTKSLAEALAAKLGVHGIQTVVYEPVYGAHLVASLMPLSGMLNWFSKGALDFDLVFTLAGGFTKYRQEPRPIPSIRIGVAPQVMVSPKLGVSAGVQTTVERFMPGDVQSRFDALVGMVARF